MGRLTDVKLRAAKAIGKAYKLSDGQQLYLHVSAAGGPTAPRAKLPGSSRHSRRYGSKLTYFFDAWVSSACDNRRTSQQARAIEVQLHGERRYEHLCLTSDHTGN